MTSKIGCRNLCAFQPWKPAPTKYQPRTLYSVRKPFSQPFAIAVDGPDDPNTHENTAQGVPSQLQRCCDTAPEPAPSPTPVTSPRKRSSAHLSRPPPTFLEAHWDSRRSTTGNTPIFQIAFSTPIRRHRLAPPPVLSESHSATCVTSRASIGQSHTSSKANRMRIHTATVA